jgi:CHAT domain-containing protein
LYLRSLVVLEKALGPEHPHVAGSLNNLAKLYAAQENYAKAEPLYLRALAIQEKALGPEHPAVATSLNNLAGVYESLRQSEKALPLRNRALKIAGASEAPEIQWRVEDGLRETLARESRSELAIFFGKQAVNTIQRMRAGLTGLDRELQRSFLQDKSKVYRGLADLLIDQGRLPEAQQVLAMLKEEEFFDFINRAGNEDNRTTAAGYTAAEQSWQKRYQEISGQLGSIGRELEDLDRKAKVKLTDAESARREQLRADRKVAQQSMDRFLGDLMRELDTASVQRNREVGERNLTNLRALQDTLGALGHGAVTLHYVMGESKLRMILTTPTIQIARESAVSTKDLNRKIQEFHQALADPKSDPLPLAKELYQLLIAPVADDLRQAKAQTLMVSLDGAMRYIPLAALHDGQRYLVEDYRIAIYTEAAKDKIKDNPARQWRVAGLGLTRKVEGFYALPSVKQEIEGIIKAGGRGVLPGEAHFDFDFTAKQLRDALDKSYPVLHIASHFVFKPGSESNSFLLLGDGSQLTLRDLKDDDFRFRDVDLITLSACETAVGGGNDANGLEIEGFGALAQKQGAKSVIATLWSVADKSTGLLMQNLYRIREQSKGITKVEALREAQLAFIRGGAKSGTDSAYSHPYFWAAFILMGNWL